MFPYYRNNYLGIATIVCAVILIAASVVESVLKLDISLTAIIFGSFAFIYTVSKFLRRHFFTGWIWAAFTFFIIEKDLAVILKLPEKNIAPNFAIFIAALFLGWGTNKLFGRPTFSFININGTGFDFGGKKETVDATKLDGFQIRDNMSSYTLNVKNDKAYVGNATIYITNNFGKITLKVPASWQIIQNSESIGSAVTIRENKAAAGDALYLEIYGNMGSIKVI